MPSIHLLSEDLINKIAAGEVIERPASVVKELLENSLDAGATVISIDIEDYGKKLIRVSDNGCGMDEEDAQACLLRHATSKIKEAADLMSIRTLGFRGEALASIAAVSQFSLITRQATSLQGTEVKSRGGKEESPHVVAAEPGTRIEVRDLFFNTPARKKFLKTDAVELQHLVEVVTRYALLFPEKAFTLSHQGQVLLQAPAVADFRENIAALYGSALAQVLLEVRHSAPGISLRGYIAPPYEARNDKSRQAFFVNSRWIRSEDISQALYDAYHSLLFVHKHPVAFLFLDIDPQLIDVNVHPHKMLIKFSQKETICRVVGESVQETLRQHRLIPEVLSQGEQLTFGRPQQEKKYGVKYAFEPSSQAVLAEAIGTAKAELRMATAPLLQQELYGKLPPLRLLGQIHKTFFVAEVEKGVVFIDQHAAHERVLYEEFMRQFSEQNIEIQHLLQGEVLEFSPADALAISASLPELEAFGFRLEPFGGNSFVVKTIPSVLGRTQGTEVLQTLVVQLREEKALSPKLQEEILTRMACRAAVMAGEELTRERMQEILVLLGNCRFPYTCPHGRPTIIKTDAEELEKKFRRK